MSEQPINRVVVVGGGTAGWLTAAVIAAARQAKEPNPMSPLSVTLLESPDIPTIGVGEGTWPSMRNTLQKIGVSETDFLRECTASFKQGTWFQNWRTEDGDQYTHPFSPPEGYERINLSEYWAPSSDLNFDEFSSSQATTLKAQLAPKQISTPEYAGVLNYGYHLDAGKFAAFLQSHCINKLKVTHKVANLVSVVSKDNGDIDAVITDRADQIKGDLFIDCTGSRALLIGQHYQIPFESKKHILFNDRAVAARIDTSEANLPLESATLSTAQDVGWIWDIGLPERRGIGHVYASDYSHDDQAIDRLDQYAKHNLMAAYSGTIEPRLIKFDPGHRAVFWHRNCVAIGMAAGFIEPLEASALVMVELSAAMIAEQMPPTRAAMDPISRRFNKKFLYRWRSIINFLKLHYLLSERTNHRYWVDQRASSTVPDDLLELLSIWQYQTPWHRDQEHVDELFPTASYQYILYGMQFKTMQNDHYQQDNKASAEATLNKRQDYTTKLYGALPDHRDLIAAIVKQGLPKF